jgi:glutaredoxin 3
MTDIREHSTNVAEIKMYTTDPCGFCRQAKALLDARGYEYEEIDLARDPEGRMALAERTGRMTFPQIMVGERPVGGFQELLAAHRAGTLAQVLDAEEAA